MDDRPTAPTTDLASLKRFWLPSDEIEPRPPYQTRGGTHFYLGGTVDRQAAQALLPQGLRLHPEGTCGIDFIHAPEGWGLAPFKSLCIWLDLAGHDAADGTPGAFQIVGIYSGRAGEIMARDYSPSFLKGDVSLQRNGDRIQGEAQVDAGGAIVKASGRVLDQVPAPVSGMYNYLAPGPGEGVVIYTNAHSFLVTETQDAGLALALPPGHRLDMLRSFRLDHALVLKEVAFTMGVPAPLNSAYTDEATRLAFLDVLSRLGRAVAIVEQSGRLVYLNGEARELLAVAPAATPARLPGPLARPALTIPLAPVMIPLPSGREVATRAIPIALRLGQGPLTMVLMTDPRAPGPTDPEPLLRLKGLTPSEAGLAALVGQGLSPADAARRRGITQATARSVLKSVFGKLGLRRQADLAILVTRLGDT